jgi:putative hydrolase of the HAD superfamily
MTTSSLSTRAVLFDLDETLYPERRFALSGFAEAARILSAETGMDGRQIYDLLVSALRRGERACAFQQLCVAFGWPEARTADLIEAYRQHHPRLRLPAASRRTLHDLRQDWRLAIVTNGPAAIQERKVRALGLQPLVDAVVYASTCGSGEGKPAKEAFLTAAHRLRVPPSRCVFVGDDPVRDIAGARGAGMKTIRVRRGYLANAIIAAADEADAVTDAIADVPRLASRLFGDPAALCA